MMELALAGQIAWVVMVVAWYVLRYPFDRRARRLNVADNRKALGERVRMTISLTGLGIVPAVHVATGWPAFADRLQHPLVLGLGIVAAVGALIMFRLTHKALGAMWSVSLQLKQEHRLVTSGVYRHLRHPMYTAFWLMALAQALLVPNWVAGLAGLVGFGTLYVLRVGEEERMMEEAFGDEYRAYSARTKRIIPFVH
jgi:protein-S-isoprenylcysteine O-methyltransferase Ste14